MKYNYAGMSSVLVTTYNVMLNTATSDLWEIPEYFRHLVPSLPATHVDDDITVGVFGQGLRDDSFTTTESSRDGSRTPQYTPKTSHEQNIKTFLLRSRNDNVRQLAIRKVFF